jgi:hypothetical protein
VHYISYYRYCQSHSHDDDGDDDEYAHADDEGSGSGEVGKTISGGNDNVPSDSSNPVCDNPPAGGLDANALWLHDAHDDDGDDDGHPQADDGWSDGGEIGGKRWS